MDYLTDGHERFGLVYILQPAEQAIVLGFALLLGILLLHNFWSGKNLLDKQT